MKRKYSMRSHGVILGVMFLLLACCIMPAGAVSSNDSRLTFEIISAGDINQSRALPIYGSVMQGETDYHSYYVPSTHKTLDVSLTWDTDNELGLITLTPSGTSASWTDGGDGNFDHAVGLRFSLPSTMTGAYWNFGVSGVNVVGTQAYTLTINSY